MKTAIPVLLIVVFLGSPLWTSLLIVLLPRRWLRLAFGLCVVQALLAYTVWWFFWGGGIGGEAKLSETWQLGFGFALLPVAISLARLRCGKASPVNRPPESS